MNAHTPGPWTIVTRMPHSRGIFGGPHQSLLATAAAGSGVTPQELDANAALIAAAPELLAALILCRSAINEEVIAAGDLDHPTIRAHAKAAAQADAAIRKAEGR